jgi:hypothetical protein
MTATVLHRAERHCEQMEKAALQARGALQKASVRDGRLMALLPKADPRRVAFEAASIAARQAEEKAIAAREALEKVRKSNGAAAPTKGAVRAALAEAIAQVAKYERGIVSNTKAIERARSMRTAAEEHLTAMSKAVEKAKLRDAEAMAKAAAGTGIAPVSAMTKARAAEQEAIDALEMVKAGRGALDEKERLLEAALVQARTRINEAVNAVLRAELRLPQVLAEASRLQDELLSKRLLLRTVVFDRLVGNDDPLRGDILALLRVPLPGPVSESGAEIAAWQSHPAATALAELRAALAVDPDAGVSL